MALISEQPRPLGAVPRVIISPERPEHYIRYINNVAKQVEARLPFQGPADVLITLGSGLNPLADMIEFEEGTRREFNDGDVGLPVGQLEGHQNKIVAGVTKNGRRVVFKVGRVHPYQTHPLGVDVSGYGRMTPEEIATSYLRVFEKIGVKNVILTSAAGGVQHPKMPGDPPVFEKFPTVAIVESDIDFRFDSPLQGGHKGLGAEIRFPNWKESDDHLKSLFLKCMNDTHGRIQIPQLVYATSWAPLFENRAIAKFLAVNGINLAGMTLSPEIQILSDAQIPFLALAIVTNPQTLLPLRGNQAIIDIRRRLRIPLSKYENGIIKKGGILIPSVFDLGFMNIEELVKASTSHEEVIAAGDKIPEILVPPLMEMINSL